MPIQGFPKDFDPAQYGLPEVPGMSWEHDDHGMPRKLTEGHLSVLGHRCNGAPMEQAVHLAGYAGELIDGHPDGKLRASVANVKRRLRDIWAEYLLKSGKGGEVKPGDYEGLKDVVWGCLLTSCNDDKSAPAAQWMQVYKDADRLSFEQASAEKFGDTGRMMARLAELDPVLAALMRERLGVTEQEMPPLGDNVFPLRPEGAD